MVEAFCPTNARSIFVPWQLAIWYPPWPASHSSALLSCLIRPSCLSSHINRPKSLWQLEMNLCPPPWPLLFYKKNPTHTSAGIVPRHAKSQIRMGPEGVNGFARSPWQLLTGSNVSELASHDIAVRVKCAPLHSAGHYRGRRGEETGDLELLGFSPVRLCQRHAVTLCLIGAGQSPRGAKGYASPVRFCWPFLSLACSKFGHLSSPLNLFLFDCRSLEGMVRPELYNVFLWTIKEMHRSCNS